MTYDWRNVSDRELKRPQQWISKRVESHYYQFQRVVLKFVAINWGNGRNESNCSVGLWITWTERKKNEHVTLKKQFSLWCNKRYLLQCIQTKIKDKFSIVCSEWRFEQKEGVGQPFQHRKCEKWARFVLWIELKQLGLEFENCIFLSGFNLDWRFWWSNIETWQR